MGQSTFDTIIISDLHLGSEVSRARAAVSMLKESSFRRLILLGDIFCDLDFGRLKKDHWQFLSYIRKLSNPKRQIEIVWVEGNHDQGLSNVMSHLVGVQVHSEYEWSFQGVRHLAIHGHQFDRFAVDNAILSRLGIAIYMLIQKLEPRQKRLTRFLDRLNSSWLRLSPKVSAGAMEHARLRSAERVFCGHTHQPMQAQADGVSYYNSGCWIHNSATYITINEEGVQLREYNERTDDRDSGEERGDFDAAFADLIGEAELSAHGEHASVCS